MIVLLQIILAVLIGNLFEWTIHRFVLHGKKLGKIKGSFFSFHWSRHHRACRKNKFIDKDYLEGSIFEMNARGKEAFGLFLLILSQCWMLWFFPALYVSLAAWTVIYYFVHRKGHIDPEWARRWTPWHWDHHMSKNQDANWGVVIPFWDWIFGTRIKYQYDKNGKCLKEVR